MEKENYYKKALHEIHSNQSISNYEPAFILKKLNKDDYIIYAVNKIDPDDMIWYAAKMENEINLVSDSCINKVFEWDFDINDILLYLEESYVIEFMDIKEHYGIWRQISEYRQTGEDIHMEGLNNYIRFCMNNGISSQSIENLTGFKVVDIFPLYVEMNFNFKIIAQTEIGNNAVVLAEKIKGPKEYVTWRTTPTRAGGYDIGHYFIDYKSAYKDFKERSHNMLKTYLRHTKVKCKPKEQER